MTPSTRLTSERVTSIFEDCLFKEGEPHDPHVRVEGLAHTFGFHPDRLESHREEIHEMLLELPDPFMRSKGGGWSFLNACQRADGEQWTSFHLVQEQLLCMAIGLKLASWVLPRDMWAVLPGGMPYVVIEDQPIPVT